MPLPKFYRGIIKNNTDKVLTYDDGIDGAFANIRLYPYKFVAGEYEIDYATIINTLGFTSGTIAISGTRTSPSINNSSTKYYGINGLFTVQADLTATTGDVALYIEYSDLTDDNWPSDAADFDITVLKPICTLPMSTDAINEDSSKNFAIN